MSWIDPLRRLIRPVEVRHVEPKPEPPEPAPEDLGVLAQSVRVLRLAHRYRQELRRAAEIQAKEQEAKEQRDRAARQAAFEDVLARSLAARWVHFPGDGDEARTPQPGQFTPLEGDDSGRFGWWRF